MRIDRNFSGGYEGTAYKRWSCYSNLLLGGLISPKASKMEGRCVTKKDIW
jgi:hypothetical protein